MKTLNLGEHEITVKRSRFIAISRHIDSRDAARAFKEELKKTHFEARHVCLGYVASGESDFGYDDDGEPNGTAGKPIYQAIAAAGAVNSAIAVVRYFGGVLLGAGGLTRAYRTAASELVELFGVSELAELSEYAVKASFETYKKISPILRKTIVFTRDLVYNDEVGLTAYCRSDVDLAALIVPFGATVIYTGKKLFDKAEIENGNKDI